jgi:hypothetical protein
MRSSHALHGSRNRGGYLVIITFVDVWKPRFRFSCRTFMSNGCWTETPWSFLVSMYLRRHTNHHHHEVYSCRWWRLPYNKYLIMGILEQAVWLPTSIRSWIRLMFKFKSPWSRLRNVTNLQALKTKQTRPETSLTLNMWKDTSVGSMVNQGTTRKLAHISNWTDKGTYS